MELSNVATLGGYKSHMTMDGKRTLCGREVSNGSNGHDMCKRCQAKADKLTAQAEMTREAITAINPEHPEAQLVEPIMADWEREITDDMPVLTGGEIETPEGFEWREVDAETGELQLFPIGAESEGTPCVSESLGYGMCDGVMHKRFGLTECGDCGLTPYNATEGAEHTRIMLALDKADGAVWERHHAGVECTAGESECAACLAARPESWDLKRRAELGEVIGERVPVYVPMSIMATTPEGKPFEFAHVPNGDPERVARFVAQAERLAKVARPENPAKVWAEPYKASETAQSVMVDPEVTEDVNGPETGVQSLCVEGHPVGGCSACDTATEPWYDRAEHEAEEAAQWADVDAGDQHYTDTDPDRLPETTTARAANGHVMEYRVTGVESDGRYKVSQWDAWHSDTCPCVGEGDYPELDEF